MTATHKLSLTLLLLQEMICCLIELSWCLGRYRTVMKVQLNVLLDLTVAFKFVLSHILRHRLRTFLLFMLRSCHNVQSAC